ncbi:MAG TPA: hypothetical protein VN622_09485 [Clostridia bacterium]|nr:hypothetical protein [Clostridia bacterium]
MDNSGWNMWVFRDGRKLVTGKWLVAGLAMSLQALASCCDREHLLDAILWAGELECALSDADSIHVPVAAAITDALAAALIGSSIARSEVLRQQLASIELCGTVRVSIPESFAYYALNPLKFADLVSRLELTHRHNDCNHRSQTAGVVGIRSIGTTLSAVVLAALRRQGIEAERITVRPSGHPYNRELKFSAQQLAWVNELRSSDFLIVDEGPGLSGSSFLATGEALLGAGVDEAKITFLGTRQPDPGALRASDAAVRWARFRSFFTSDERYLPEGAGTPLGGGAWRKHFLPADSQPGSWTQMEPLKFLSADRQRIFRFEGYGRYGAEVGRRSAQLALARFAPGYFGNFAGFGCYQYLSGRPALHSDLSNTILQRMADYCAFRACAIHPEAEQPSDLERMLRFDWKTEFGIELGEEALLQLARPVVADGRMLPHKWFLTSSGEALKLDAATHGDDHFFPGPCDIAWDLAGTIVEWGLGSAATETFLARYKNISGDDPRPRLKAYLLAYGIFRCAYMKMAAKAMGGTIEEPLLHNQYMQYRAICERIYNAQNVELAAEPLSY